MQRSEKTEAEPKTNSSALNEPSSQTPTPSPVSTLRRNRGGFRHVLSKMDSCSLLQALVAALGALLKCSSHAASGATSSDTSTFRSTHSGSRRFRAQTTRCPGQPWVVQNLNTALDAVAAANRQHKACPHHRKYDRVASSTQAAKLLLKLGTLEFGRDMQKSRQ